MTEAELFQRKKKAHVQIGLARGSQALNIRRQACLRRILHLNGIFNTPQELFS